MLSEAPQPDHCNACLSDVWELWLILLNDHFHGDQQRKDRPRPSQHDKDVILIRLGIADFGGILKQQTTLPYS